MKSRIPQIQARLPIAAQAAVKDAADRIAAQAKATAPVRTGNLKASIDVRPGYGQTAEGSTTTGHGIRWDVVAAWYWFLVEFGHGATRTGRNRSGDDRGAVQTPPHPFMIPAAEAERPRMLADFKRALGNL